MFGRVGFLTFCVSRSQTIVHWERKCHGFNDHALSKKSYWNSQYQPKKIRAIDWLAPADVIADHVISKVGILPTSDCQSFIHLLDLGCGTSDVPLCLAQSLGVPLHLVCLDYVPNAARWQTEKLAKSSPVNTLSTHACITGDVRALPFRDKTFHVVLEKGTLDSLLKDRGMARQSCDRMMAECIRVLRTEGVLLQITDEDPDLRIQLLEDTFSRIQVSARVSYTQIDTQGQECFMYAVTPKSSHKS